MIFEIINEPNGLTEAEVDEPNSGNIATIRETNPTRIVVFSGNKYANFEQLVTAKIPEDLYLIGYYHSYDPWDFS